MVKIRKSVLINSPVKAVYDYLIEPRNLTKYWPNIVKITDIEPLPNGGYRNNWEYRKGVFTFKGSGKTTACCPDEFIEDKISGGINSYQKWTLADEGGKTRATFEVEYSIRIAIIGPLIEKLLVRSNHREGDEVMCRLATFLDAGNE